MSECVYICVCVCERESEKASKLKRKALDIIIQAWKTSDLILKEESPCTITYLPLRINRVPYLQKTVSKNF